MTVERSKKTINAWAKFLDTPEGEEGIKWLKQQRPTTILGDGPHVFNYSHGRIDEFLRLMDVIESELPVHPKPEQKDDDDRLLPTG